MASYPVPFEIDRSRAGRLRLRNRSPEALRWVRVETTHRGLVTAPLTPCLQPGAHLDVRVRGEDLAADSRVIVRWRRPNGDEYLYGIAL